MFNIQYETTRLASGARISAQCSTKQHEKSRNSRKKEKHFLFLKGHCCSLACINIYTWISNTSVRLHADDTTVYGSDVSPVVLEYSLNSDLHLLSAWGCSGSKTNL